MNCHYEFSLAGIDRSNLFLILKLELEIASQEFLCKIPRNDNFNSCRIQVKKGDNHG